MEKRSTRKQIINEIAERKPSSRSIDYTLEPISEVYGKNVFSERIMRERLPKSVFKKLQKTLCNGEPLDPSIADIVANAMKDWAVELGATHYTHWFHPMTGLTAEKHDSFATPTADGHVITEFSGKMLIKGEPDASSFPSGGIRSTFEARGYTAWDPTSPAFIMENVNGRTLCIPTAFCSYTGEALDRKTPLLRSIEAVSKQALRILRIFGNTTATRVNTTVGAEQEYFLIDKKFYLQRPDLINAGRTLYGSKPPKGQELEDHYFGSIRPRVLAYMMDVEKKLFKLGIPVKTRHNEVAPAQFEIAPVYEIANVATDHNMLVMETLKATAEEHGFVCLLHEKPFAGVNGSGKHNNWSMCDSDGNNLLEPGDTPHQNAQFLVFLAAVLRAVHKHSAVLRLGIVGAGNDHRLGANEAPPAIISVFLGDQLNEIVHNLIRGKNDRGSHGGYIEVGATALPRLPKDSTDRNRTSPFAFTGNKFEFRAVGSSQSIAPANIAINVAISSALDDVATELESEVAKGVDLNSAVQKLLEKLFKEHEVIIFDGDNYSAAWQEEAAKRGLLNLKNSVDAIEKYLDPSVMAPFIKFGILNEREIHARYEILLENYCKSVSIEAQITTSMGRNTILPTAIQYQKIIAESVVALQGALGAKADTSAQKELLTVVTDGISKLKQSLNQLQVALTKADDCDSGILDKARLFRDAVLPAMSACRAAGDILEHYIDDSLWPLPKYREMLWIY